LGIGDPATYGRSGPPINPAVAAATLSPPVDPACPV